MKRIILTVDYELFFGRKSGTVKECMIETTSNLVSLLEKNQSKMTVFWDILHYYRLLELENKYSELKTDRILIKEQIIDLVKKGHDIQLHLHPHWLDAKYENHKWIFNYDRFRIDSLSNEINPDNINTILGCFSISKKLIEDVVREEKPDYKVQAFRAGGLLIEPFYKLRDSLLKNEIYIDSSVSTETTYDHEMFSYNFKKYPKKLIYKFDSTPGIAEESGQFIEIPISSIKIPIFKDIYFKILRRWKYSNLNNGGKGESVYHSFYKKNIFMRVYDTLLKPYNIMFSIDSNYKEKYDYLFNKVPEFGTMILHPKSLNMHNLSLLNDYLSLNQIQFISLMQYLKDKKF